MVYLKDGELVHLTPTGFVISTLDRADITPIVDRITWSVADAELNGYAHFMEKEIFEQPLALENTMRGRFSADGSTAQFGGLNLTPAEFRLIDRFMFCACGTAWHACLVAEHLIERFARVPVEVDYASEFRYRNSPLEQPDAVLCHQPVGRDHRHPGSHARGEAQGLSRPRHRNNVVRVQHRAQGRRGHLPARRPREIGVASTKAFTSQLMLGAVEVALYVATKMLRHLSFSALTASTLRPSRRRPPSCAGP